MSKHDSSLSKDQYNLLKSFKKQITQPQTPAVVAAPVEKTVEQEALEELELFRKQMQGVQKIESGNTVQLDKPRKKKPDAQILAKRAAATGPMETGHGLIRYSGHAQSCRESGQLELPHCHLAA